MDFNFVLWSNMNWNIFSKEHGIYLEIFFFFFQKPWWALVKNRDSSNTVTSGNHFYVSWLHIQIQQRNVCHNTFDHTRRSNMLLHLIHKRLPVSQCSAYAMTKLLSAQLLLLYCVLFCIKNDSVSYQQRCVKQQIPKPQIVVQYSQETHNPKVATQGLSWE